MEPLAEIAKQLQDFRRENSEQLKKLRSEIAELKRQQGEILAELQSGKRSRHLERSETVKEDKEQPATLEMYCSQCLQLRLIVSPKQVMLPDGSAAIQGQCAVCGTKAFRMASMSGVLVDEAASARLRRLRD